MEQSIDRKENISVVIPVYNHPERLRTTLKSVLNQTYPPTEIIVVDDGSLDPPNLIIGEFNDNRIVLYQIPHQNANIARNYGIIRSTGKYIAMLDADDQWLEQHLERSLQTLKDSNADGVYGGLILRQFPDIEMGIFYARELNEGESMVDYMLTTGYGAQTSTLFTTSESARKVLWDPALVSQQDYDFVFRYQKKYKIVPKKEPTTIFIFSADSLSHTIDYDSYVLFAKRILEDVDPVTYNRYNMQMYSLALQKESPKDVCRFFRKEATRYKECMSYQTYISIRNPQSWYSEWRDKFIYLLHILRVKIEY